MSSPLPRPRMGDGLLAELANRLTDRDRMLANAVYEHRVLTTQQICDLAFSTPRRAELRLTELYRLRVLDRFRPFRQVGSAPYHYVLDEAGAAVVAAERGVEVCELGWRRHKALAVATSQRLAHLVGVNGFFCALVRAARTDGRSQLVTWWSERRCRAEWGELVCPDGYGVWVQETTRLPFCLEYDRGSERLDRLRAKLDGYQALAAAAGHPTWVLFSFPSSRREAEARRVLATSPVPVATTARASGEEPDRAVWLPLGRPPARLRLAQLGQPA